MRRTSVVAVLVVALLVPAAPATLAAPGHAVESAEAAAKKRKSKKKRKRPVRCKAGQVKERVKAKRRKTRTRCVSARKAWPAPKPVDMRTESTSYLLDADFSKVRDRRGRRAKSLPKLLRRIHPRAERALERATKAGLARIDATATASQAGGCGGPSQTVSSTFDAGGGQSVDLQVTSGPEASVQLGLENVQGNRKVRIEIEFPGCESHTLDSCPTADGIVRGRDDRRIAVRAVVTEGNAVVWSQGIRLEGETTFRGGVADDAKLDFLEPHNTEVGTLTLGGSSRGFAPLSMRMLVQRITRVDMRTGQYSLGPSIVNVTISSPDLTGPAATAAERDIERGMREQADQQFRDIIDKGIRKFRTTEEQWNQPNTCATIEFTPASGAKTLHIGDTGTVSANLLAKPGGSPSTANWTHTGSGNGTFTPGTASSVPATFSYSGILNAGEGIFVTGSWKAVSKAGVAQATWTQPTENLVINTIAGTFSGSQNVVGTIFNWAGEVTFRRVVTDQGASSFALQSGSYEVTASGKALNLGCNQSGTTTVTFTAGDFNTTGQGQSGGAPFDYTGSVIGVGPQAGSMSVRLSNCFDSSLNGKEVVVGLTFSALKAAGQSADGVDYSGSLTESHSGLTDSWRWALRGTR